MNNAKHGDSSSRKIERLPDLRATAKSTVGFLWTVALVGVVVASVVLAATHVWISVIVNSLIGVATLLVAVPWVYDVMTGVVDVQWLHAGMREDAQAGTVTFWHLSRSSAEEFARDGGIDLGRSQMDFLGSGFYVWSDLAAAEHAFRASARSLIRLAVDADSWNTLRRVELRSKTSWQYVVLNALWFWRGLPGVDAFRRRVVENLFPDADTVAGPALGLASRHKQVLLRNTPACERIVREARVGRWPIRGRCPLLVAVSREERGIPQNK